MFKTYHRDLILILNQNVLSYNEEDEVDQRPIISFDIKAQNSTGQQTIDIVAQFEQQPDVYLGQGF